MKQFLISCICIIITVSLTGVAVFGLGVLFRPVEMDTAVASVDSFYEVPENTLDVMFFGSSHM